MITFGFVILNFKLNKKDWMAPAVIFSAVIFLYTFGCVIEKNAYDIVFIPMTVFVISAGIAVFTLISGSIERSAGETVVVRNPKSIEFHDVYVVLLIIAQLLSIIFFIKYLGNLADAYSAVSGETYAGLGAKIELYDTNIFNYIFTYVGAPIVNLDTFLRTSDITFFRGVPDSPIFAAHNFSELYAYQV